MKPELQRFLQVPLWLLYVQVQHKFEISGSVYRSLLSLRTIKSGVGGTGPTLHRALHLNRRDRSVSEDRALEISTSPSLAIVRPSPAQVRNLNPRDRAVGEGRALEISTSPSLAIVRPSPAQVRNL